MNILLFDAAKYWSGGAERVYLCCKGFKEKGHNVVLVCLPTSRLNLLLKDRIKVYNIHPIFDLDFFAGVKIFYLLLKHKIDVIDIHSPKFYWLGVFIGKLLNKKVFITRNVEYRKKGLKRYINKLLYYFCNGVITVSEKIKNNLIVDFGIKSNKIKVIYDAIEAKSHQKDIRVIYEIPQDAVVLSIIGRIEENKSQHIAVEVAEKLFKKGYNVYLFVVGQIESKSYYHSLIKLVNKIRFKDRVIFTGFVSNVEDYIYSSDIILCCSKHEGIPRTVVESVVLGKPVVSTTAAKIEEIFDEHLLKLVKFVSVPNVDNFVFFVEEVIKNTFADEIQQ